MHLLERGACRAVQAALRLVMPVLPYRDPKLLCSTAEVPTELAAKGVDSVLLVTDAALEAMGMTHALEQALAAVSYTHLSPSGDFSCAAPRPAPGCSG